jgi:hypothetical protein
LENSKVLYDYKAPAKSLFPNHPVHHDFSRWAMKNEKANSPGFGFSSRGKVCKWAGHLEGGQEHSSPLAHFCFHRVGKACSVFLDLRYGHGAIFPVQNCQLKRGGLKAWGKDIK